GRFRTLHDKRGHLPAETCVSRATRETDDIRPLPAMRGGQPSLVLRSTLACEVGVGGAARATPMSSLVDEQHPVPMTECLRRGQELSHAARQTVQYHDGRSDPSDFHDIQVGPVVLDIHYYFPPPRC